MKRIAVLVSGGGTNLGALFDAEDDGRLESGRITLVISSRPDAYALTRAETRGVEAVTLRKRDFPDQRSFDGALLDTLLAHSIDLVVLAGYLGILSPEVVAAYPGRIVNVHPSLIPAFCGRGMYGLNVHEAALRYGVKITGATVHLVNDIPDGGEILLQKAVEVREGDTPETLQRRVMEEAEWVLLPEAVERLCRENQE